jgi:hypothetical protein
MIRAPDLDDIDFETLVEQARALIPRFAPDWTDHNIHDPGITLLDLIAWVADSQIYRIGFVGDRHLTAFAALLGVAARRAEPARGLLWPDAVAAPAVIAQGRKATTGDAPDIAFATQAAVQLAGTAIVHMRRITADGTAQSVGRDQRLPVSGGDRIELRLGAPLAPSSDRFSLGIALDPEDPGDPDPGRAVALDLRVSDTAPWQPVADVEDCTGGLARSGVLLFRAPAVAWLRLRVPGYLPAPVAIDRIALDVVPIVQIATGESQPIGTGTGLPDQTMALDMTGLLAPPGDAIALDIRSEDGVAWVERADLDRSGPGDADVVRDTRAGVIRFGNGVNGRRPPPGVQLSVFGLRRTLGAAGNLGAGRRFAIEAVGAFGTNPAPLAGGRDADTIDDLVEALRLRAARRDALVTDDDLRDAALGQFGVADAEILHRVWPPLAGTPVCNARTLVVRTRTGRPPQQHVAAIGARLAPRRILGERLFVVAPDPVPIAVEARIVMDVGDPGDVVRRIGDALDARFSDGTPIARHWPAGRPVTPGEIEALIAGFAGVRAIASVRIAAGDAPLAAETVALRPTQVAVLDRTRLVLDIVGGRA